MPIPVPGTVAARVTVTVMMLLLAIGGRPVTAVGTWLSLTFIVTQATTSHEEEEERHASKGATATSQRRIPGSDTPAFGTTCRVTHGSVSPRQQPAVARVATHRDADLRNGIGTSLRC